MASGASLSPYCGVPWRGAAPFAVGFTWSAGQVGVEDGPAQPCPETAPGRPFLSSCSRFLSELVQEEVRREVAVQMLPIRNRVV